MLIRAPSPAIRLILCYVQKQHYVDYCVDVSGQLWLDGLSVLLDP
ncbi:MAG: hypothetical protein RJA23_15 [Bacteroidota bacterium]|jgi:hypothetical protein